MCLLKQSLRTKGKSRCHSAVSHMGDSHSRLLVHVTSDLPVKRGDTGLETAEDPPGTPLHIHALIQKINKKIKN